MVLDRWHGLGVLGAVADLLDMVMINDIIDEWFMILVNMVNVVNMVNMANINISNHLY